MLDLKLAHFKRNGNAFQPFSMDSSLFLWIPDFFHKPHAKTYKIKKSVNTDFCSRSDVIRTRGLYLPKIAL